MNIIAPKLAIAIFKDAKSRIWDGTIPRKLACEEYVCHALSAAINKELGLTRYHDSERSNALFSILSLYVKKRINGEYEASDFLRKTGHPAYGSYEETQAWRIAMVEDIIEDLKTAVDVPTC